MKESPWCTRARLAAVGQDGPQRQLIELLKPPVHESEKAKISRRIQTLFALAEGTTPDQAVALLKRFSNTRDPLWRFFKCRLATWTRNQFKKRLRANAARATKTPSKKARKKQRTRPSTNGPGTDDPGTNGPGTDDPGTDDPGTDKKTIVEPPRPKRKPPTLPKLPGSKGVDIDIGDLIKIGRRLLKVMQDTGVDAALISSLESAIDVAAKIVQDPRFAIVLTLFAFNTPTGKLAQHALARGATVRAMRRAKSAKGWGQLELALKTIADMVTSPKTAAAVTTASKARAADAEVKEQKKKQLEKNKKEGEAHEKAVCDRVRKKYPYHAEQVHVRGYVKRSGGMPGQAPSNKLALAYLPSAQVDCVGAYRKGGPLHLFEAKLSGAANLKNKNLTNPQQRHYPAIKAHGGIVAAARGPFKKDLPIKKGTVVKVITPDNLDDI